MLKILLSTIKTLPFDFEAEVRNHIAALKAHQSTEGEPAPSPSHAFIEHAIARVQYPKEMTYQPTRTYNATFIDEETGKPYDREVTEPSGEPVTFMGSEKPDDFVPNYEIVDDTPPPPLLDERKAALADAETRKALALADKIFPKLKRQLFAYQRSDARTVTNMLDKKFADGLMSKVEYENSVAPHRAIMAEHVDRDASLDKIDRHLAQVHSDIHDLTETTIDGWHAPPFPA